MEYRCEDCGFEPNHHECRKCGGDCAIVHTPEDAAAERVRQAAPELLAALELWAQYADNNGWTDADHHDANGNGWITQTRAAIARAKGELGESDMEQARRLR